MKRRLRRRVRRDVFLDQRPGQFPPDAHRTLLTLAERDEVLLLFRPEHPLEGTLGPLHPLAVQTFQITAARVVCRRHPWLLS
jgi:hypothetical protein